MPAACKLKVLRTALLGVLVGCAQAEQQVIPPDQEEGERLVRIGTQVSDALTQELKAALSQAMAEGGVKTAIEVCSTRAIALTEEIAESFPGVQIRRTSRKFRNAANAPDALDLEALAFFEDEQENGKELSPHYIRKVIGKEGTSYRYYRPLKITGMCLGCHGSADRLNLETQEILQKIYPEDQATGYQNGEFRGVISLRFTKL